MTGDELKLHVQSMNYTLEGDRGTVEMELIAPTGTSGKTIESFARKHRGVVSYGVVQEWCMYNDSTTASNYKIKPYLSIAATNTTIKLKWDCAAATDDDWTTADDWTTNCWYRIGGNDATCDPQSGWISIRDRKTPEEKLKEIIASRQAPFGIIKGRDMAHNHAWSVSGRKVLGPPKDEREFRARETLMSVIGERKFRSYILNGFVSVRNPASGRVYQIHPGHGLTYVYEDGKLVERLCVVLKGDFPPTDSVIVRYLMALNNEKQLWDIGIKHGSVKKSVQQPSEVDQRPLIEIFSDLKRKSA